MNIPKAKSHFKIDWGIVPFAGPLKMLILCDVHSPYHSVKALELALKYGVDHAANCVLLNGDFLDFEAPSRHQTHPRHRNLEDEIEIGIEMLKLVRELFPKAKVIFKEGNHEERWEAYLIRKCEELVGIKQFSWEAVFELDKLKIQHIGDKRPMKFGKLMGLHGHEYYSPFGSTIPAKRLLEKAKTHVFAGHHHYRQTWSDTKLDGSAITSWVISALCNRHPGYRPLNNWQFGFAFADILASGNFQFHSFEIVDGEIYH